MYPATRKAGIGHDIRKRTMGWETQWLKGKLLGKTLKCISIKVQEYLLDAWGKWKQGKDLGETMGLEEQ